MILWSIRSSSLTLAETIASPPRRRGFTNTWPPALGEKGGSHRDGAAGVGYRAGAAVVADRDIGEDTLGHLDPLAAEMATHPGLDTDGDRGAADPRHRGVAAHLVADIDRPVEGHAGHRDGGDAALGTLRGDAAAGEIHLGEQPAAEDIAVRIGVARHRDGAQRRLAGGGRLVAPALRRVPFVFVSHGRYTHMLGQQSLRDTVCCLPCS